MDRLIFRDKSSYRISGGCTALVALFILDKLYVANAGDSRACCFFPEEPVLKEMSFDFTPMNDRQRIQLIAFQARMLFLSYDCSQSSTNWEIWKWLSNVTCLATVQHFPTIFNSAIFLDMNEMRAAIASLSGKLLGHKWNASFFALSNRLLTLMTKQCTETSKKHRITDRPSRPY